jgi:signal peptidase
MRSKLKLIFAIASLPVFLYLWPASLGGDTEFISVSGISMLPTIQSGSLAIVKKSPTFDVGDIAVYNSDILNRTVIHRIIALQDNGFVFQGDNNPAKDPGIISQDKMRGKVIFVAPLVGFIPQLFKNPLIMAVAVLGSMATMYGKKDKKGKKQKKGPMQSFFLPAILVNLSSYILVQISISVGIKPNMDGFTNYLFKILEPSFASTIAFAIWFFAIIGIHFVIRYYQGSSSKKLEQTSKNSTIQLKEENSLQLAGEVFYVLLLLIQTISLVGIVKGLLTPG